MPRVAVHARSCSPRPLLPPCLVLASSPDEFLLVEFVELIVRRRVCPIFLPETIRVDHLAISCLTPARFKRSRPLLLSHLRPDPRLCDVVCHDKAELTSREFRVGDNRYNTRQVEHLARVIYTFTKYAFLAKLCFPSLRPCRQPL